eukprot:8907905-Alexandrium_andersonii.AAC.1
MAPPARCGPIGQQAAEQPPRARGLQRQPHTSGAGGRQPAQRLTRGLRKARRLGRPFLPSRLSGP